MNTISSGSGTTSSLAASETPITLDIGGRRFRTLVSTLTKNSNYFASKVAGLGAACGVTHDNIIFEDGGPELFEHILRYLRHGALPLFWTKSDGFDYARYIQLLQEARHYGLQGLVDWINRQGYLRAITVTHSMPGFETRDPDDIPSGLVTSNVDRSYFMHWTTELQYHCPRSIAFHHGQPSRCGNACERAKDEDTALFRDVPILKVCIHDIQVDVKQEELIVCSMNIHGQSSRLTTDRNRELARRIPPDIEVAWKD
ncbi:MAG: hypothetical protein M1828_006673 [Chrysothrix sp. TS-e1954]|nr:MAG: hypothetical protein M1828_006673 [Chrysothrix sp. TS-e1954]